MRRRIVIAGLSAGAVLAASAVAVAAPEPADRSAVVLEPVPLSGDVLASIPYRYPVG